MADKRKGKKFGGREISSDVNAVGNQWQSTPRQTKWLEYYMDSRNKDTYANAYASAIKAGYSESYARNMMNPSLALEWVKQANNLMRMNPEHLKLELMRIVINDMSKDSDKIQAIKLLGTDQGMFVQKQITQHVGLEEAINALEEA